MLITHGTSARIEEDEPLGLIARHMHRFAEREGVSLQFDIVTLDWRQFATNPFSQYVCGGEADDVFDRGFDPYEAARFGQHYARGVLRYFDELGVDVGGLVSLHTIGHSSGSYVADAFFDVLASSTASPFGGERPSIRHLTMLDAYLPPQRANGPSVGSNGDPLGILGTSATEVEQYMFRDIAGGTNNEANRRASPACIDFDITHYVDTFFSGCQGHGLPIQFYADSFAVTLPEQPLSITALNDGITALQVFARFGGALSPLAAAAGTGTVSLGVFAGLEDGDGDIDVVTKRWFQPYRVFQEWPASLDNNGTNVETLAPSGLRLTTGSPAIATLTGALPGPVNTLEMLASLTTGGGAVVQVTINNVELPPVELTTGPESSNLPISISLPTAVSGPTTLQIRVDPIGSAQAVVELRDILLASATFAPFAPPISLPGDANGDCAVTFLDITTVLTSFGTIYGVPPATGPGDADADGGVNFRDITTVLVNFGSQCEP